MRSDQMFNKTFISTFKNIFNKFNEIEKRMITPNMQHFV